MILQLWFYQISYRLERLTWTVSFSLLWGLECLALLRSTWVGFCCPFRSQYLSVARCIIASCIRPQKEFLATMSILWVYLLTAKVYFKNYTYLLAILAVSLLTMKQPSSFSLKGSGLNTGMQLILCRAFGVYVIHYLFQRSSLEEEVGLSGDNLPANSQIRLFSLQVLLWEPILKGRKDYQSFFKKVSVLLHCQLMYWSWAEQDFFHIKMLRSLSAWVESLCTTAEWKM